MRQALIVNSARVLPQGVDTDALEQSVSITNTVRLGSAETLHIYPLVENGEQTGVVIAPVIVSGYSSDILLLAGIDRNSTLTGIDIIHHQETIILSDPQLQKDLQNWLQGFAGKNIANNDWALKNAGGDFDYLSGATITARTIVNAAHDILQTHERQQPQWYQTTRK